MSSWRMVAEAIDLVDAAGEIVERPVLVTCKQHHERRFRLHDASCSPSRNWRSARESSAMRNSKLPEDRERVERIKGNAEVVESLRVEW